MISRACGNPDIYIPALYFHISHQIDLQNFLLELIRKIMFEYSGEIYAVMLK